MKRTAKLFPLMQFSPDGLCSTVSVPRVPEKPHRAQTLSAHPNLTTQLTVKGEGFKRAAGGFDSFFNPMCFA